MKKVALALIRFYQNRISPGTPAACRYIPSCSQYMFEAIERFGVIKGIWLGTKRIARCHPLNVGGYDPIPTKGSK